VIRTNLATRPFYNERAVRVWLLGGVIVVVAATLLNVTGVLRYSGSNTELAVSAARDEGRAVDLRRQAARLRSGVDMRQIDRASNEAQQANELIDRRTFSWTELLNRFESTLPDEVRIAAVRPRVDQGPGTVIDVVVFARTVEDVNQFMQNLQQTGAFPEMRPIEEHTDEQQNLLESTIEARYLPSAARPAGGAGTSRP
jgi:type IV pilus assembly protein PilN